MRNPIEDDHVCAGRLLLELPPALHAALTHAAALQGASAADCALSLLTLAVHDAATPLQANASDVDAQTDADAPQLTPREIRVLRLLSEGRTRKEAARVLGIEPDTVGYYTKSIYRKLAVTSCTAAVAIATRTGLL